MPLSERRARGRRSGQNHAGSACAPSRTECASSLAAIAHGRSGHVPVLRGILELSSGSVEALADLEVDRRFAFSAWHGHSRGVRRFSRGLLRDAVDPNGVLAVRARHLTVDRDEAVGRDRRFLDVGLAAAVEVLPLLGREEQSSEIVHGDGGIDPACHEQGTRQKRCQAPGRHEGLIPLTETRSTWQSARSRGRMLVPPGAAPRSSRVTLHWRTDTYALLAACRSLRKSRRSFSCSRSMSSLIRLTTKSAPLAGTTPAYSSCRCASMLYLISNSLRLFLMREIASIQSSRFWSPSI